MAPNRQRLPRLPLQNYAISIFDLFLQYPWDEGVDRIFRSLVGEGRFVSRTPYTASKHKHLITINARRVEDEAASLSASVRYTASPTAVAAVDPKKDRREAEFVERVLALSESTTIGCSILFVFQTVEPGSLWFPLPSRVGFPSESGEEFEIRGVRGAKLTGRDEDPEEFGFILDRPTEEMVYLDLHFHLEQRFTLDVPQFAIERGMVIAEQLVGTTPRKRRGTR